jgi:hypothetical protein
MRKICRGTPPLDTLLATAPRPLVSAKPSYATGHANTFRLLIILHKYTQASSAGMPNGLDLPTNQLCQASRDDKAYLTCLLLGTIGSLLRAEALITLTVCTTEYKIWATTETAEGTSRKNARNEVYCLALLFGFLPFLCFSAL